MKEFADTGGFCLFDGEILEEVDKGLHCKGSGEYGSLRRIDGSRIGRMKEFVFRSEDREPRSTRRGRTYLKSHERNEATGTISHESVMHKRTIRRPRALTLFEKEKKNEKKKRKKKTINHAQQKKVMSRPM